MKSLLLAIIIHSSIVAWPQAMMPLDSGSSVAFNIRNFGLQVDGSFTGLHGLITFDPKNLNVALFDLSVKASTVNTGIDLRDSHLRRAEYFDAKQFPTIRFISKRVERTAVGNIFVAVGSITIKGTTKEIKFPFTVESSGSINIFTGAFPLKRSDFNIGGKSFTMSDEVIVSFNIKASYKDGAGQLWNTFKSMNRSDHP